MPQGTGTKSSEDGVDFSTQTLLDILNAPHVSKEARENAIEAIYRRYTHDILHIIRAKVRVIEDVWDIHSEVWQCAFERLRSFTWQTESKAADPLKSWLLSIAHHKMQEYWREYPFDPVELIDAHLTYFDQYETLDGFEREYPTVKSGEFRERMDMLLTKAQRSLGPLEQKVILLTYYNGKNSREIGELLQITPENVRTCRHRAIKKLRAFFEQQAKKQEREIHVTEGGGHASGRQ
jgi:RNA polymerase sigma factor (sigma-70 family)